MTNIIGEYVEFIYCYCGCKKTRSKYNQLGKECKFVNGCENRWKKMSDEQKKKISDSLKGTRLDETNPAWKGEEVRRAGLHMYVRTRLPKTEFCQVCNKVPPYDLANKTGKYLRDLDDWWWLCRSCHKKFDLRYKSPEDRRVFIDNFLPKR